jgi:thiamine biosynthesis lipoprotein
MLDVSFACMGTTVRIVASDPGRVVRARDYLADFDRRLSRFRDDSELSALNADPREEVPASALLRAAVHAGLWAATTTDGLVDPTVADDLERAGYDRSMHGAASQPLGALLADAPPRRAAAPNLHCRWRDVVVDDVRGVIRRPPGTRLDTGGTGKGLAADAVAHLLDGEERFVVDCGGDVRVGGPGAGREPFEVSVVHPLTGRLEETFPLGAGGVATSGIDRRVWRAGDGRPAHHLIDPSTGRPAWTGLVGATAIAPSALEADVLAKAAVLSGPERARELLRPHGGILFHESGRSERVRLAIPRTALRRFAVVS